MSILRHIGRDKTHTFCGNSIVQQTKRGPQKLIVSTPEYCQCQVCLTNYYNLIPPDKTYQRSK